jgi:hypothetical protein
MDRFPRHQITQVHDLKQLIVCKSSPVPYHQTPSPNPQTAQLQNTFAASWDYTRVDVLFFTNGPFLVARAIGYGEVLPQSWKFLEEGTSVVGWLEALEELWTRVLGKVPLSVGSEFYFFFILFWFWINLLSWSEERGRGAWIEEGRFVMAG